MNSQLSTFMALSGLAAANIYLTDPRPAWIWAEDGKSILWANPAGAAFFGVKGLSELADLTGLARAPARPHIARVATSGPIDRDTTDRLRFYRGLRVMLLTCACRRLVLADGSNGALIVALDAPGATGTQDESALLALISHSSHAAFLYRRDGSVQSGEAGLAGPALDIVKTALRSAKHAPLRRSFEIEGADRDASVLMLDTGSILLLADMTNAADTHKPALDAAAAMAVSSEDPDGFEPETAGDTASMEAEALTGAPISQEEAPQEETPPPLPAATDAEAEESEPAAPRRRWAQGGLFAFASGTRFLSASRATDRPADETSGDATQLPPAGAEPAHETHPGDDDASGDFETVRQPEGLSPVPDRADEDTETAAAGTERADTERDPQFPADADDALDLVGVDDEDASQNAGQDEEDAGTRAHAGLFSSPAEDADESTIAGNILDAEELTFDDLAATGEEAHTAVYGQADVDAADEMTAEEDEAPVSPHAGPDHEDDAVPAVDLPAAAASGFRFDARERPVRFAWKMDIDRRFTFLSPEFAETLGPEAADVVGLTWEEVAERFDLDRDGRVSAALRRRDTWSGRTVAWPVSGAALRVPVDMAALPAFDRQRIFEGFRGFGVCRTGEAVEDTDALGTRIVMRPPLDAAGADPAETDDVMLVEEPVAGELTLDPPVLADAETDPSEAPEDATAAADAISTADAGEPAASDDEDDDAAAEPGEPAASGLAADDGVEGFVEDTAGTGAFPALDDHASEPEADDRENTFAGLADATSADDLEEEPEITFGNDDERTTGSLPQPDGDADANARGNTPESPVANVSPDPVDAPADFETAEDEKPLPSVRSASSYRTEDADTSRLSKPEREAFRKIAEALGARSETGEPEVLAAAPQDSTPSVATDDAKADADLVEAAKPTEDIASPDEDDATGMPASANVASLGIVPRTSATATPRAARTNLLDKLPVGVAIIDGEDVDYANATLLDLLGYPDLEALHAVGGLDAIFAEPEDWPSSLPGAMTERTMRIRLADGGAKPVKSRLHSVAWKDGTALMMSLLDRHDPAQEAALDRLHETQSSLSLAEEHLAEMDAVLETATDGVLILDEGGRIMKVNRSAEALFDAAREDMVGAPLSDYLAPESHRDASDYLDGLARNGVASVLNDGREVIGQLRSGGLIPLFMTIGRVGHGAEGPRFCTVLRDITQWKTAEEELTDAKRQAENASSQKSDFLAKISHEIRTPLNAIIGFSEVMMEERFGPVGNDRYKGYLRDIHNSGSHIMSLINDLLDLSKIEAGKLDLTFEAVSANDIIRECVALMQPQANRERVIIRASLPTSVPKIVADGRSVRQIVLNLLSNAIKFNQPGGQVIVSTALEDSGEVILRVRDTGMGMSHQDLAAAMEPFRQLHTARHGGGTGLGLPLTKALVEANRASFRIDSEVNHGTLIEVTFPPQRVLAE
ncbi:ATP-binding protein [Stappia sp. MMSF_3263]|uniref:ATP-binding protein n=1 Tax=Stappia sp. MMSF_3263 TaxID=3046693 RepID=UPI00273ED1EB|nr:ATP-binding protein [Stappia sp. MMSF_3263]